MGDTEGAAELGVQEDEETLVQDTVLKSDGLGRGSKEARSGRKNKEHPGVQRSAL